MNAQHTIHPIFWLWLPILWMIGQLGAENYFSTEALLEFHRENGLHEWLQFGFLCGVFILSCKMLLQMDKRKNPWLTAWIAAAALGSLYVGGEEISWGQWIFYWQTPEEWAAINGQNETNLHNTSKWLNQKPRALLEIGILVGGIIIPAVKKFKPTWVPKRFEIIYPPNILIVTALIAAFAKIGQKISKVYFDTKIFQRASEVEELYIFYFLLLYIIVLSIRVLKERNA